LKDADFRVSDDVLAKFHSPLVPIRLSLHSMGRSVRTKPAESKRRGSDVPTCPREISKLYTAQRSSAPCPESGGFRYSYASPSSEAGLRENRRTHDVPNSSLSLSLKASPFRLFAHLLRLRCSDSLRSLLRVWACSNGRTLHVKAFICETRYRGPRAPFRLRRQTASFEATATRASGLGLRLQSRRLPSPEDT
jgi:hypothetical protein